MTRDIAVGALGAVVGGMILYFALGIPEDFDALKKRVAEHDTQIADHAGQLKRILPLQRNVQSLGAEMNEVREVLSAAPRDESSVTTLTGNIVTSGQWKAGWIDLGQPTNFNQGARLRLRIGGSANRVIVRLRPEGEPFGKAVGVLSSGIDVPATKIVEVTLAQAHQNVIQIAVHGGRNPFGRFPLGVDNGSARLESIELISE